jgi:hypothetical protein
VIGAAVPGLLRFIWGQLRYSKSSKALILSLFPSINGILHSLLTLSLSHKGERGRDWCGVDDFSLTPQWERVGVRGGLNIQVLIPRVFFPSLNAEKN